jgi:hypothetical protein
MQNQPAVTNKYLFTEKNVAEFIPRPISKTQPKGWPISRPREEPTLFV